MAEQNGTNTGKCAEEYVVKRGDSFYLIAHKLGVPLRDLLAAAKPADGEKLKTAIVTGAEGGFAVENIGFVPTYCWEVDGVFTTIPALPYYDEAPEGMSDAQHQRLRKSVDDVTALMGGRLTVLET